MQKRLLAAVVALAAASAAAGDPATGAPRSCGGLTERVDLFPRLWSGYQSKARLRWSYYGHPGNVAARAAFQRYYTGQARRLVESHLRRGSGDADGDNPALSVRSIRLGANEQCARLWTTETWHVTRGGRTVYRATNARFTIWQQKRETRWVVFLIQTGWRT